IAGNFIKPRKDETQNMASAPELIGSNRGKSEENCNRTQDAGSSVVAGFQQVGNSVLSEFASARSDKNNDQQSRPSPAALPQAAKTVLEGVLRASEQTAGADPGGKQGKDQHVPRQSAARDQVICFRFYFANLAEAYYQQYSNDDREHDGVKVQIFSLLTLASALPK